VITERAIASLSVLLLGFTVACAPKTQNVLAFTASAKDTHGKLDGVLELGYPSCIRTAEYDMLKEAIDAPPEVRTEQVKDFEASLAICDRAKEVRTQALAAASTVAAFAAALDALANNRAIEHVPAAASAGQGQSELRAATDDTTRTISDWATARYRKRQLGAAIAESSQSVGRVLRALRTILAEVHGQSLAQEKANLLELFRRYDRAAPVDPITSGLRGLELQRRVATLDARLARAGHLLTRLDHMIAAHERLVQAEGALEQTELLAEIRIALADTFAPPPPAADPPKLAVPRAAADPESAETPASPATPAL